MQREGWTDPILRDGSGSRIQSRRPTADHADRYGNRRFDANNTTTLGSCSTAICNPTISTSTNRISSTGYSFDPNGSVTQDATGQRFGYDAENHQKEFFAATNQGSTPDATYLYDGSGLRVKKITSTETTVFVYDASSKLIAEYSTEISQTPQVSYLTTDQLGSPRVITNENGVVKDRKDYSAFGEESTSAQRGSNPEYTPPDQLRIDYTGYEKDAESGLEFAQARYYNPTHGRYTTVDPLTASASIKNPQTLNRYSYVINSPYKFVDPLGLLSVTTGACGPWCRNGEATAGVRSGSGYQDITKNFLESQPTDEGVAGSLAAPPQMGAEHHETTHATGSAAPLADPAVRITRIDLVDGTDEHAIDILATGEVVPSDPSLDQDVPIVNARNKDVSSRIKNKAPIYLRVQFQIDEKEDRASFATSKDLDASDSFSAAPESSSNAKWCEQCKSFPVIVSINEGGKMANVYIRLANGPKSGTDERINIKATVYWVDKYDSVSNKVNVPKNDTHAFQVKVKYRYIP